MKDWRWFNFLWLVPVFSIVLVGLVLYQNYQPNVEVKIRFQSAQGLDLSKRIDVRYRNLVIGRVSRIEFDQNLESVIVHVSIDQSFGKYLNANARFWVVRPRLDMASVSGVDTILSGNYIAGDFSVSGQAQYFFNGLEEPPIISDMKGFRIRLVAKENYNLNVGSPVYFNRVEIGRLERRYLFEDRVEFDVFIENRYAQYVSNKSVFWNTGSVNMTLQEGKFSVGATSLKSLFVGGIEVSNPEGVYSDFEWSDSDVLGQKLLYPDRKSAFESAIIEGADERLEYVLLFSESVDGLKKGTPIEMLGINVGQVKDVFLDFQTSKQGSYKALAVVLIEFHLNKVQYFRQLEPDQRYYVISDAISDGMRFRISASNLLTGERKIELFFDQHAVLLDQPLKSYKKYVVLPVSASQFNNFQTQLLELMDRLNGLPIGDFKALIHSIRRFIDESNHDPQRFIFGD